MLNWIKLSAAFDMVLDPVVALETLISLGFHRVLTSGCDTSALEGLPLIKRLVDQVSQILQRNLRNWVSTSKVKQCAILKAREKLDCHSVICIVNIWFMLCSCCCVMLLFSIFPLFVSAGQRQNCHHARCIFVSYLWFFFCNLLVLFSVYAFVLQEGASQREIYRES